MNSTTGAGMDYHNVTTSTKPTPCSGQPMCMFYVVTNMIIIILGVAGNGLVIWIAGFKVKKSVNSSWYLSLALSDLLFCLILPFFIGEKIQNKWVFGLFMCKFRSFIMFLNWFSSIYLLVIIAVDRCVVVAFPVWAQNKRSIRKASLIIVSAWILSAALSTPMAIFRVVEYSGQTQKCTKNYTADKDSIGTVSSRFLYGFAIPLMIIIVCYLIIIRKLMTSEMAKTKKPLKVMSALIITFFICWMPFHIFSFLEINYKTQLIKDGKTFSMTVANANSFLNPFLYAFMGKDIKNQCHALLAKIQNAIEEDSQPRSQGTSYTTSSVKQSTAL